MSGTDEKESQLNDLLAAVKKVNKAAEGKERFREKALVARHEFFDKLVILDGGTIALSVSLLGNLASRHTPELVRLVGASWILLVIGMALGMSRNWLFQEHQLVATDLVLGSAISEFPWAEVDAIAKMPEIVRESQSWVKQAEAKLARLRVWRLWCERMCIASTLGGYGFLIWFAIRNLSTFTALK